MRENARKDHFNQAEPIEKANKPEDIKAASNLRNLISKSKSIDEKKRGDKSRSSSAAGYKSDVDYTHGNKSRKLTSTVEKQPQDSELGGGAHQLRPESQRSTYTVVQPRHAFHDRPRTRAAYGNHHPVHPRAGHRGGNDHHERYSNVPPHHNRGGHGGDHSQEHEGTRPSRPYAPRGSHPRGRGGYRGQHPYQRSD